MSESLLQKPNASTEVYGVLGFLKIVKESIKIIPKNGKIMVTITLFSLLPSLLFLLLVYFLKFLTNKVYIDIEESLEYTPNQIISFHFALFLLAGIAFVIATVLISQVTATVVVVTSAISYTGDKPSLHERVTTMRQPKPRSRRRSWKSQTCRVLGVAALTFYLAGPFDPGAVGIVAGTAAFGCALHAWVEGNLAAVVTVLEEGEAAERASELVVGHRLQGFMLNLLVQLTIVIVFLCYSMILEDKWYLNVEYVVEYVGMSGSLLLIVCFMAKIFVKIAYTVLYFECKRAHEQEIDTLVDTGMPLPSLGDPKT